mmetsp:Transcript_14314/g.21635  ORF Transcript_14314/g.21635 Transcript_14314/m.21635 type:complete len:321 (-) Transcript_14314:36-998(-)
MDTRNDKNNPLKIKKLNRDEFNNQFKKACKRNNYNGLVKLMEVNYNPHEFSKKEIRELFGIACINTKNLKILDLLLEKGMSVTHVDERKRTVLHNACMKKDNEKVIEWLLKNKAEVNAKDKYGRTPLMYAIIKVKSEKIVKLLLEYKADVNVKDKKKLTPLSLAKCNKKENETIYNMIKMTIKQLKILENLTSLEEKQEEKVIDDHKKQQPNFKASSSTTQQHNLIGSTAQQHNIIGSTTRQHNIISSITQQQLHNLIYTGVPNVIRNSPPKHTIFNRPAPRRVKNHDLVFKGGAWRHSNGQFASKREVLAEGLEWRRDF